MDFFKKKFQGIKYNFETNIRDRTSQPSRNSIKSQTPQQKERNPFNKTPETTPGVNDQGSQNGRTPEKEKQRDNTPFKKSDEKDTPRVNMVCDKEQFQKGTKKVLDTILSSCRKTRTTIGTTSRWIHVKDNRKPLVKVRTFPNWCGDQRNPG